MSRGRVRRWLLAVAVGAASVAAGVESAGSGTGEALVRVRAPSLEAATKLWYAEDIVPAAPGRPWTVVGYLVDAAGRRTPSAWTSADAVRWRRTTLPRSPSPGRDGVFTVAGRGDVLAAFGQMDVPTGRRLAAWTRRAGGWSFATEATAAWRDVKQVSIEDQAAGTGGFVAVGDEIDAVSSRAVILESVDARSWRPVSLPELAAPPGLAMQMSSVALRGTRAVVVGSTARRVGSAAPLRAIAFRRDAGSWSAIEPARFGGGRSVYLNGVAPLGAGFVVVGARSFGAKVEPAAWISTNGVSWRSAKRTAFPVPKRAQAAVFAVEQVGGTALAIGRIDDVPWAWASEDGLRWRHIRLPEGVYRFGLPTRIALASSGRRLLLVVRNESGAMLWLYDGRWRNVGRGAAFPSNRTGIDVAGVASSGGRAVAVGAASVAEDGEARVWARAAKGWTRGILPSAKSAALTSVAGIPGGFVAGGLTTRGRRFAAALWRSNDGRVWTRASVPAASPSVDNAVQAVVWDGRRAIAVVNDVVRRPPSKRITLWSSEDGRSWRRLATVAKGQVGAKGVCVGPAAFLVVGGVRVGNVERAAVWQKAGERWRRVLFGSSSQMRSCAVGGREVVVVGTDHGHATSWLWTASASWQQARQVGDLLPSQPPRVMEAVAATATGFVAVGGDGARGQYDLGVWTSTDGYQWRLVRNGARAFRETGHQQAAAVAVDDRGRLVVGGRSVGSGALWEGTIPTP